MHLHNEGVSLDGKHVPLGQCVPRQVISEDLRLREDFHGVELASVNLFDEVNFAKGTRSQQLVSNEAPGTYFLLFLSIVYFGNSLVRRYESRSITLGSLFLLFVVKDIIFLFQASVLLLLSRVLLDFWLLGIPHIRSLLLSSWALQLHLVLDHIIDLLCQVHNSLLFPRPNCFLLLKQNWL